MRPVRGYGRVRALSTDELSARPHAWGQVALSGPLGAHVACGGTPIGQDAQALTSQRPSAHPDMRRNMHTHA